MPSAQTTYPSASTATAYPVPPPAAVATAYLALALIVSQAGATVTLEGLAVVYPPVTSSGGIVA